MIERWQSATAPDAQALEQYRTELTGYCYRMLGSAFEAEDAVQETMLRAWRALDKFEGRSQLRSWLYSIATNVCLDVLGGKERKVRPMQLGEPGEPVIESLAATRPEGEWILPMPDGRVVDDGGDPAEVAASKETLKLAFVAALQFLPPKQRAVLILRDVLRWKASEVASLLDTSEASVNSALQRARATIDERGHRGGRGGRPDGRGARGAAPALHGGVRALRHGRAHGASPRGRDALDAAVRAVADGPRRHRRVDDGPGPRVRGLATRSGRGERLDRVRPVPRERAERRARAVGPRRHRDARTARSAASTRSSIPRACSRCSACRRRSHG